VKKIITKKIEGESVVNLRKLLIDKADILSHNQVIKIKALIQTQTEQNNIVAGQLIKAPLSKLAVIQLLKLKYSEEDIGQHPEIMFLMMEKIVSLAHSNSMGEELNEFSKEYKYKTKL